MVVSTSTSAKAGVLRVPLEHSEVESEELSVEKLGHDQFLVTSIPLFTQEVALGDIVLAREVDEILEFRGVFLPGNNQTIRLLVDDIHLDYVAAQLTALGVQLINPLPGVLAFNLAPHAPRTGIYEYLSDLKEQGIAIFGQGDLER